MKHCYIVHRFITVFNNNAVIISIKKLVINLLRILIEIRNIVIIPLRIEP